MNNPFELIINKIDQLDIRNQQWIKLSIWCDKAGVSADWVKDTFPQAVRRPGAVSGRKSGVYMIDQRLINKLINES